MFPRLVNRNCKPRAVANPAGILQTFRMARPPAKLSRDYRGYPIRQYGRKLVATMPGPRGAGRKRKSARPSPDGLAALQRWIDS